MPVGPLEGRLAASSLCSTSLQMVRGATDILDVEARGGLYLEAGMDLRWHTPYTSSCPQ